MIVDVLKILHGLKKEKKVRDFMLIGAVAAMAYVRPFFSDDVDIALVTASDAEFLEVFRQVSGYGTVEGYTIIIAGVKLQLFPLDISAILADAYKHSKVKRVQGMAVKVAPPEHLVIEALRVYRAKDKARVHLLMEAVSLKVLAALFRRLDTDGTLRHRFKAVTGQTIG